jgi:2-keto-4-pentenoate hydratase
VEEEMTQKARLAADLLLAARADPANPLPDFPEALRPADRAEAYAIQRLVAATFGAIGGWKVGPYSGVMEPTCSPLPASVVVASPARFVSTLRQNFIEAEVSFTIGRDLPPRATPYAREEIVAALATAHPTIELVQSRFDDIDAAQPLSVLADNQSHYALVVGPGRTDWRGLDFDAETVEQYVDGHLNQTHRGNPAGDMIRLVQWLANTGAVWAGGLKAGQVVTCGSWTGKTLVGAQADVRVHFPSLGEAHATYTA